MARWIQASLVTRVAAEVGLEVPADRNLTPLEVTPPVVTAYIAKGKRRHTVILPFVHSMMQAFAPWTHDPTVYDPGWYCPVQVWREITPANRLIATYYLWPRLSQVERIEAQPFLEGAFKQSAEAADSRPGETIRSNGLETDGPPRKFLGCSWLFPLWAAAQAQRWVRRFASNPSARVRSYGVARSAAHQCDCRAKVSPKPWDSALTGMKLVAVTQ